MKILSKIGNGILALVILFITAVLAGTILYFFWPLAIPAVFPRVVKLGFLAEKLTWLQAVALTWITAILFGHSTTKDKEK